jgi:DNA-binding NarL/FixJ family response regulator
LIQNSRPTVLLADDHPVWRTGLRRVLESAFEVVAEACDGKDAVEKARTCCPDVVVMDMHMPGMNGITATREIKEALPDTSVVMVSIADEQVHESILAGARGYVVKDDNAEVMLKAVQAAANGEAYLPPLMAKRILQGMRSNNGTGVRESGIALSQREVEVLRLVGEGHRDKQIARQLGISIRTVSNHVASIYNKLGIDDRAQAIIYAIKQRIVKI